MHIEAETRRSPTLDPEDARRFEGLAAEWWDERGKFRALHAFNPARLKFMIDEIAAWRGQKGAGKSPLQGLSIVDVGCGGGILSEPLARLGASVTGVDPVAASIEVAKAHARAQGLSIDYRAAASEDLQREGAVFDVVVASEVVEHVADVPAFMSVCRAICRPGGLLLMSTINRTAKSYALVIVGAEWLLGLVPRGTHDWGKFLTPAELEAALTASQFRRRNSAGIVFNPLAGAWQLSASDLSVNYILSAEAV